ncbi:MAG: DMT family transporter [Polyangiaceae bacterium]
MLTFVALCLIARFNYSLNDVFIGRLARRHGRMRVAAFRGLSLGASMTPWLLFVPAAAWSALSGQPGTLLFTAAVTAVANILQFHGARYLPFGLRAAIMLTTMATTSLLVGWLLLDERLSALQIGLCAVLVGSALAAALGSHVVQDIEVDIPRGAMLTVLAGVLMIAAVFAVKRLAHATHPLLAAWAWEFGAGLILLGPVLLRARHEAVEAPVSFWQVALAALPTALASGASVLALDYGELGLWGAIGGTQILFTAAVASVWQREALGLRRWLCMAVSTVAVAGLALSRS